MDLIPDTTILLGIDRVTCILAQVGLQIDPPSRCASPTRLATVTNAVSFTLPSLPKALTLDEKKYLLSVERGDLANVRRYAVK